jgi:hypothetical protein
MICLRYLVPRKIKTIDNKRNAGLVSANHTPSFKPIVTLDFNEIPLQLYFLLPYGASNISSAHESLGTSGLSLFDPRREIEVYSSALVAELELQLERHLARVLENDSI